MNPVAAGIDLRTDRSEALVRGCLSTAGGFPNVAEVGQLAFPAELSPPSATHAP